jgi:CDGSH-type Zn-finger protein
MSDPKNMKVVVTKDGPYLVSGEVPLARQTIATNAEGESVGWVEGETIATKDRYALCRCGHSATKPFCDGSHKTRGFDGTETASRAPYREQARELDGPAVVLTDAQPLCAFGRFCDAKGKIWNVARRPGDEARAIVEDEAGNCPAGRLVAWDRTTRQALEPALPPSIGVVHDPAQGVGGPIWVRGGIPVTAADGTPYEVRNRVALCRCGASSNKPFCDGSHASESVRFQDESHS